jgi:uncharacterized protein (DUF1330 family)
MSAYLLTDTNWNGTDRETIVRFGQTVGPVIAQYGGKFLVDRGAVPELVEGDWLPTTMNILEFPSADAIRAMLASAEFQAAAAIRRQTPAVFKQILVPGASS